MQHLAAYYKSVDPAAALTLISAVADQAIFTSGNDVRVPTGMSNLIGEAGMTAATGPGYAEVQSPSLRDLANLDVLPIAAAAVFANPDQIQWHPESPRVLVPAESVNFAIEATGGAAAANYGLIWLADGAPKPSSGNMFTVRATSAIALAAGTWVNGALTFNTSLPAGTYDVVGLRAQGANLVAARLVFIGGQYRPGVPGETSGQTQFFRRFRFGRNGTYGSFDVNQPPTVDALGVTDTSQIYEFDLIKTK